ncbi:MAG: ABC transporter permease [Planctomycetes bacterium]|nr:ABC transporter permease [Planctomycetota bacterium]
MNLTRIYAVFLRQIYLIKANPIRLAGMFVWLLFSVIQWGFISKYLGTFGQATFGFVTVVLGAIILWEFMGRVQAGIMMAFLEDIWSQNFFNYFASPLKISEYLAGLVITSIVTALIGFVIMILIAGAGFGYNFFIIGVMILPFIMILFVFGVAMGIFITGVIFRLGPAAEWLGWPIPFIMSIFAGVFYPISVLPDALQVVAGLIPASYVFESMRIIFEGGEFGARVASNLAGGTALALAYLAAAYYFFMRVYKRNLKHGNIGRFSAEV